MGAQVRERLISARDQPLVRIIRVGELEEVALVEQSHLQGTALVQLGDGDRA